MSPGCKEEKKKRKESCWGRERERERRGAKEWRRKARKPDIPANNLLLF